MNFMRSFILLSLYWFNQEARSLVLIVKERHNLFTIMWSGIKRDCKGWQGSKYMSSWWPPSRFIMKWSCARSPSRDFSWEHFFTNMNWCLNCSRTNMLSSWKTALRRVGQSNKRLGSLITREVAGSSGAACSAACAWILGVSGSQEDTLPHPPSVWWSTRQGQGRLYPGHGASTNEIEQEVQLHPHRISFQDPSVKRGGDSRLNSVQTQFSSLSSKTETAL